MLMVSSSLAFSQQRTVSGKVVGEDGSPIPFATVQIMGTTNGTTTDQNGLFKLDIPPKAILRITYVGFNPMEVNVGSQSSLNITLVSNARQLNEIVVTALGIKREARSLGYDVQTVTAKDLTQSKPVNIANGLVGRVAGLQISTINNGVTPDVRVTLRGERHINSDNQALIVLDGVPISRALLPTINPNDIADVTVLKGASAAALYGTEATNGVLIITTKKGTTGGKPVIRFSNTTTLEQVSYPIKLQNTFSGYGGESGILFNGKPAADPNTGFANYIPFENQNYGPAYNGDAGNAYIGGPDEAGKVYKTPFEAVTPDPRIAFFNTGVTVQNDLSYSGGDAKNSYFVSAQDVNITGVVPKDIARRTGVRFEGKRTFGIFSATYGLSYTQAHSNTVGLDYFQQRPVYWNLLNTQASVPLQQLKATDTNPFAGPSDYYNAYYPNPYWQINHARDDSKSDFVTGDLALSLQPLSWLNLTYRANITTSSQNYYNHRDGVTFTPYSQTDPWSAGNIPSSLKHTSLYIDYGQNYARRMQGDFLVTLDHKFGDFSSNLVLGNSIWDRYGYGDDLNSSTAYFSNISYIIGKPNVSQYTYDDRLISGFAALTEGYKNFLFVNAAFRKDWSSLLAKGHNSYDVYSIGASFVLTDAIPSLKDNKWLTYAKLRSTYSSTGQISVNPYSVQNVFDVAGGFPIGSTPGLVLSGQYNNPNLVPEHTIEKEGGIELGFWNSRVNLDVTYYHDNTTNQTFPVQISTSTGYASALVNGGNLESDGWEFSLDLNPLSSSSPLRWDISGNFSIYNSKVLSLYGGNQDFDMGQGANHAHVGDPFPVLEVSDLVRDPANGKIVVDPNTGYPLANPVNVIAGRTSPHYILGFNTSLTWKHLTLQAVADYRGGYNFFAVVGQQLDFTGASAHTTQNGRQRFIFPNSEIQQGTKYAPNTNVYTQDGSLGFWVYSPYPGAGTSYIISADAWKLRSVSLSYDFSSLINKTKFIKGLTFTLVGNDLLMFVPSQNVWTDPEFNYANTNGAIGYTDYNQLPPTRKFGANLSLTF